MTVFGNHLFGGKEMSKGKRFEVLYTQGTLTTMEIWVDNETGVNYLFHQDGHAGGLTPLLDKDGKPIITQKMDD